MEHFRVLPTDPKFINLTIDQMELLYVYSVGSPTDEEMKHMYRKHKKEMLEENKIPENKLEEMGYSENDIKRIKEVIKNNG